MKYYFCITWEGGEITNHRYIATPNKIETVLEDNELALECTKEEFLKGIAIAGPETELVSVL